MAASSSQHRFKPWDSPLVQLGARLIAFEEHADFPVNRVEPSSCFALLLVPIRGTVTLTDGASNEMALTEPVVLAAGTGPIQSAHAGNLDCIEAILPPWGLQALFGAPVGTGDGAVRLSDVIGSAVNELMDVAQQADRLDQLEWTANWLSRRAGLETRIPSPQIRHALRRLRRAGGQISIAELAAEVGWCERHLAIRFRDAVGLSPKMAARHLRFHRAHSLITGGDRSLADIAAGCGYADQSHLTREFTAFAGLPPGAVRNAKFDTLPSTSARS